MLTLILGGARSGKSRLAQRLATPAGKVSYVATAKADADLEMVARIERHRADRPREWQTIEEPLAIGDAIGRAAGESDVIIVDCLTLWLSNLMFEYRDRAPAQIEEMARLEIERVAAAAARRHVIAVSNELGCGTVPETEVGRAFRDLQGFVNQRAAELADEVIFTVAGLPLYLKGKG